MAGIVIGPHASIKNGYLKAASDSKAMGANAFQFFTRNPQGGRAREFNRKDARELARFMADEGFGPIMAHAPYTLNLASSKKEVRDFARQILKDDLARLEMMPCSLYNIHPGSHTGDGVKTGIERVIRALNECLTDDTGATVVLELMSGQGTEIGKSLDEMRLILDGVERKERIGFCVDTCHVYSAGYDIKQRLGAFLAEFDIKLGLSRLRALHINDSKTPLGSRKDRHERLGAGTLGRGAFTGIIRDERLRRIPMYLETPNKAPGFAREIAFMRRAAARYRDPETERNKDGQIGRRT